MWWSAKECTKGRYIGNMSKRMKESQIGWMWNKDERDWTEGNMHRYGCSGLKCFSLFSLIFWMFQASKRRMQKGRKGRLQVRWFNGEIYGNFIGRFQPKEIVVQRCEPTVKEVCEPVPKTVCQDKCIDPSTNHQVCLIIIFAGFENCRDEQKRVILEYLLYSKQTGTYY